MWGLTLILLLLPLSAQASCTDNHDPVYNFAVSQGDYEKAFRLIARELRLNPEEERHIKIIEGFSSNHDDRHGEADPESLELHLDPNLFLEGKEGACQGITHELTHLRQFRRDRARLHAFFSTRPVSNTGWNGCERDQLAKPDADQAEEEAYSCLQDNDLFPHNASDDIEAVLAQIPYATGHTLRDEDLTYLAENLKSWSDHASLVSDQSNESYYLPEIKREDIRIFCRGTAFARKNFATSAPFEQTSLFFCHEKKERPPL